MGLTAENQVIMLLKFLGIAFVIGAVLITIYYYNETKDYASIRIDDSFVSRVISTKRLRADTRVQLESGELIVLPYADNYNYRIYRLSEFVKEGDILIKRSGSDTLIVKRYEDEYLFVMGKVIKENQ